MKETRSSKQMSAAKKGLGFQKQKWHVDLILLTDFYRKISLVKNIIFHCNRILPVGTMIETSSKRDLNSKTRH